MNGFRQIRGCEPTVRLAMTLLLLTVVLSAGCAVYQPRPSMPEGFLDRMQTSTQGEVEVSVAVPSAEESRELFGVDLAAEGIQPVWLRIRNNEDFGLIFIPLDLDPNYFSAHEAAWRSRFFLSPQANEEMNAYFRERNIHRLIASGHTTSGFVFTPLEEGYKFVSVQLQGVGDARSDTRNFLFTVAVPGIPVDREQVDFDNLYDAEDWLDIEDPETLRAWIADLPCCVVGEDGETFGDPLNLVLIGQQDTLLPAFIQQDWHPTETSHGGSVWRTVRSSLFGSRYRYSPVSPLYLFGRPQDTALQKARETIDERNHLRVWLAPVRYRGARVWVGQISRDIGVRLTGRLWPLTTHVIDPEVDEARWYLLQDLIDSQRVVAGGFAAGVGRALPDQPRVNLLGDPYYTDGLRLVLIFGKDPVSYSQVKSLRWEQPPDVRRLGGDQ